MKNEMEEIIVVFVADYDSAPLWIHDGYETWADAQADARSRQATSDTVLGHKGQWTPMRRWELEII